MNSFDRIIHGFIKLGRRKTGLIEFSPNTTMSVINHHVYNEFNNDLPCAFHIGFYSDRTNTFLQLDEQILNSELNPFQFDPMDCVELFIIEDPSPMNFTSFSGLNEPINNVLPSNAVDNDSTTINSILSGSYNDDDFFETMLSGLIGADCALNPTPSDEFDDIFPPSLFGQNSPNTVISQNNISTDSTIDDLDLDDILHAQLDSQDSTTSFNDHPLATEATDDNNRQADRIYFSHDVQPGQKHHYLSNKYNTDNGVDEHGGISYIQGVKSKDEIKKKTQVLPHISIPRGYRDMQGIDLLLYAVVEEQENGMRVWYKNFHKGFLLHNQLKADAEFFNPILLNLNHTKWNSNGDLILEIYLLTKRDKISKIKEKVYELDETAVTQIHKADHIVSSKKKHLKPTRLLAVFNSGNGPCWNTFGLSNFIQPPSKNSSTTQFDSSRVQIALPSVNINSQPSTNLNFLSEAQIVSPALKRKKC